MLWENWGGNELQVRQCVVGQGAGDGENGREPATNRTESS